MLMLRHQPCVLTFGNKRMPTGITHERVELCGKLFFFQGENIVISQVMQCLSPF